MKFPLHYTVVTEKSVEFRGLWVRTRGAGEESNDSYMARVLFTPVISRDAGVCEASTPRLPEGREVDR